MNRLETYFDAFYAYFTTETVQFLKTSGQFENLGYVIMSTRENIRLIARAPFMHHVYSLLQLPFSLTSFTDGRACFFTSIS